jgi:hypothetical protein
MVTAETARMGSATVTELPLRLHRVEPDPFLDPAWDNRAALGRAGSGSGDLTIAPAGERDVDPDELRARGRHADLAA